VAPPSHHHYHHAAGAAVASSPSTSELSAAFAASCEVDGGTHARTGPLGVPTAASASAGAPPLLAGIDEDEDLNLVFGEDDDDLLRALDTADPRAGGGPPPPGLRRITWRCKRPASSALWWMRGRGWGIFSRVQKRRRGLEPTR
jgi:hypothetical protein